MFQLFTGPARHYIPDLTHSVIFMSHRFDFGLSAGGEEA